MNKTKPIDLKCCYLSDPLGIDPAAADLSWVTESQTPGFMQSAYRITAATSAEMLSAGNYDLWDTGKVQSGKSAHIAYEGKNLTSGQRCCWTVTVWGKGGEASEPSDPAFFEAGIVKAEDWHAKFIGLPNNRNVKTAEWTDAIGFPAPLLRKDFTLSKPVKRARAFVTALGLYEFKLNGSKAGDQEFAPGCTDYNKRLYYQTYDVTDMLKQGSNTAGAILADGWYAGQIASFKRHAYGQYPLGFLAQIEIEFLDGSTQTVLTDDSWKASMGPFIFADILHGEFYDARLEQPGWDAAGFDDSAWAEVTVLENQKRNLEPQMSQPVKNMLQIGAATVKELGGKYIFDMGQNMVGHVTVTVKGKAGTKIMLRYGEMLNQDGTLYTDNLRSARATDYYIKKSDAPETYTPRFTFHGFRFCEISGIDHTPDVSDIIGNVLYSAMPATGSFECSNPMVNKLYSNIVWGQRGNFLSIPTDCPQRDERLGWTGDAQIFIRTACANMDAAAFFRKWMIDVEDAQKQDGAYTDIAPYLPYVGAGTAAWGDAGTVVPWTLYRCYGDTEVIRKHFDSMLKYIEYMKKNSNNLIRPAKGYGDWLSVNADTPKDVLATAYFAYSTDLLAKMADIIGKTQEAADLRALFAEIKASFNREFVQPDGRITGDTQTCYLLAIHMDLLSDEGKFKAAEYLVEDLKKHDHHITTGFVGISYLLPVLTEYGYNDIAYRLLQNDTYPSWGYSIKNGATTIWERWNSYTEENGFADVRMNSFNHYSLGSVGEWMFRYMAGIETDDTAPGYSKLKLQPRPGPGIDYVKCSYKSLKGEIVSNWERQKDGSVSYFFSVPANVEAELTLPSGEKRILGPGAHTIKA